MWTKRDSSNTVGGLGRATSAGRGRCRGGGGTVQRLRARMAGLGEPPLAGSGSTQVGQVSHASMHLDNDLAAVADRRAVDRGDASGAKRTWARSPPSRACRCRLSQASMSSRPTPPNTARSIPLVNSSSMPALLRFGGCIRQRTPNPRWVGPAYGRARRSGIRTQRGPGGSGHRELGKHPRPARTGWSCSSEGMGMHRDCPSLTAVGRCEGHAGARLRRLRHYGRSLELDRSVSARMRCRVRWPIRLMAALVSA